MKKTPPKPAKIAGHLPPPPPELKRAGRELWSSVVREFEVDDAGGRAVQFEACAAADMVAACRERLAKDGLTVPTKNGGMRDHPLTRTLLMSQSFMTRSLIRLGAIDPPRNPVGRPTMGGRGVTEEYRRLNGDDA